MMSYKPDEEKRKSKFDDKQNVSFKASEWNGWHNSWLHGCFFVVFFPFSFVLRLLLNANSSTSRKAGERSENQINRVYYVIVFHPRTFIQKVTFRGRARKQAKTFLSSLSLLLLHFFVVSPLDNSLTVQRLSYWFSFSTSLFPSLVLFYAHNSEGNLHKSVITYTNPMPFREPSIKFKQISNKLRSFLLLWPINMHERRTSLKVSNDTGIVKMLRCL